MEINSILIDTNAYAEFKKGNQEAIEIIQSAKNIIINPIVIGELISGFIIGKKEKQNRQELQKFINSKRIIEIKIDSSISEEFALIFKELKIKGRPIPTNDIWIAAIARKFKFTIFSYDKHFHEISGLKIISKINDIY